MLRDTEFALLFMHAIFLTGRANYDPNMDSTFFEIEWPGSSFDFDELDSENSMLVTSVNNEKYRCILPSRIMTDTEMGTKNYVGPTEFQLLEPLMDQTSCSYRIEAYWTYELCHGKHIRQYHEEKEMGKKPKMQEYFLGTFDREAAKADDQEKRKKEQEIKARGDEFTKKVPMKKVEGAEVPYYSMNYTGGTRCELINQARSVNLLYTCHKEGKGEIYEIKEISSCVYDVTVLTNLLCKHPSYEPPKEPVNSIKCHNVDGSPVKPQSLIEFEADALSSKYNKKHNTAYERIHKKGSTTFYQKPAAEKTSKQTTTPEPPPKDTIGKKTDQQLLKEFLKGDFCIKGGTGWWKHEFCYGKKVTQYHEEKNGKTVIFLGTWNENAHFNWLKANPSKKPKTNPRTSISQYYGNGDICELNGRPRFTEVKLKCKENKNQPHSVAIYLVEPKPCEYIVVVESPILCSLVEQADGYGIIPPQDL